MPGRMEGPMEDRVEDRMADQMADRMADPMADPMEGRMGGRAVTLVQGPDNGLSRRGMLLIYTGKGKGKTSAAVGQAIRAHGQGLRVAFGQFVKRDGQAGEQTVLRDLLGDNFYAAGEGFFRTEADRPRHREAACRLLVWAGQKLEEADMLVLDEGIYALDSGLASREEIAYCVEKAEKQGAHLVLTGRNAPDWLVEKADIVSSIDEVKHAFRQGQGAHRGIEY